MNDDDVISGASIEGRNARELQRDEDVISLELQRELETLGTCVGVIAVFALVASQLTRARTLLSKTSLVKSELPRG